jgi:hypothetical protein
VIPIESPIRVWLDLSGSESERLASGISSCLPAEPPTQPQPPRSSRGIAWFSPSASPCSFKLEPYKKYNIDKRYLNLSFRFLFVLVRQILDCLPSEIRIVTSEVST